jgi:heterodisulfide reductase subunit A
MSAIHTINPQAGAKVRFISDLHYGHERCEAPEPTALAAELTAGVDMLVLLIGMRANDDNMMLTEAGLEYQESGFMQPRDLFLHNTESNIDGIFYAGTITSPKSVGETLSEATSVAHNIAKWFNHK